MDPDGRKKEAIHCDTCRKFWKTLRREKLLRKSTNYQATLGGLSYLLTVGSHIRLLLQEAVKTIQ